MRSSVCAVLIQEYNLLHSLVGNGVFEEEEAGRLLGDALAEITQIRCLW